MLSGIRIVPLTPNSFVFVAVCEQSAKGERRWEKFIRVTRVPEVRKRNTLEQNKWKILSADCFSLYISTFFDFYTSMTVFVLMTFFDLSTALKLRLMNNVWFCSNSRNAELPTSGQSFQKRNIFSEKRLPNGHSRDACQEKDGDAFLRSGWDSSLFRNIQSLDVKYLSQNVLPNTFFRRSVNRRPSGWRSSASTSSARLLSRSGRSAEVFDTLEIN